MTNSLRTLMATAGILAVTGCSKSPDTSGTVPSAATIEGLDGIDGPITLVDGLWEDEPFQPGAASRPVVRLAPDFQLAGDLDADGQDEILVLVDVTAGGSGSFPHLVLLQAETGRLRNTATVPLGDRVQVRDGRLYDDWVVLDVVRHGADDPACCPTELVTLNWRLVDGALVSTGVDKVTGTLSLHSLSGATWVLRAWDRDEPAPADPPVIFTFADGRLTGHSGCNAFFATPTAGDRPGTVAMGPVGGTRMACPEQAASVESRFLRQLQSVVGYGFYAGRLVLTFQEGQSAGAMFFTRGER